MEYRTNTDRDRLKLLQLNVTANWGSTGKIAEGIGMAALEKGWESAIAYGRYHNPSKSKLLKVGNQFDVYLHYAQNRILDQEGLGSKIPTKGLIQKIKDYKPDIIQLHNIHDHWINYRLLFDYFSTIKTPIIWTFHDCWSFTGGCTHFENNNCFEWQNKECAKCAHSHKNAHQNWNFKFDSYSSIKERLHIVTVSQWLAKYVEKSFFKHITQDIQVINNGIDIDKFNISSQKKENLILGVSNVWDETKGLNDFINLRQTLPPEIKIVLIGLTEQQIKDLPNGIEGKTRTNSIDELAAYYQVARIFVNPTYNDSFPTVNLEALACGTPVFTYRTGGSPEAINKKTGIVFEKGDLNTLTKEILKIFKNENLFKPEECRLRAEENFNKNIQFNKYINLYERLIQNVNLQR